MIDKDKILLTEDGHIVDNEYYGLITEIEKEFNRHFIITEDLYNSNDHSGGKVRDSNGSFVELIMFKVFAGVCEILNINDYEITGKNDDSIRVKSKNGYIDVSVDVHLKINGVNIIFSECKTYLDKCYLDRANSDMSHLKKQNPNSLCIVLSIEDSVKETTKNYFMDDGYIDDVFYLVDGKRNSKKPIWKRENRKEINKGNLLRLIECISNHIKKEVC